MTSGLKALCCVVILLVYSCDEAIIPSSVYSVADAPIVRLYIEDWDVRGPFETQQDSSWTKNHPRKIHFSKKEKGIWHEGTYHPKYGQLDLREVYGISISDTTKALDSMMTELSCTIKSRKNRQLFLYVRTEMDFQGYMNGEPLKRMGFKDMNIYPVHLKTGSNLLRVKVRGAHEGYWYEATLYDSVSIARMYAEQHTGNIITPIVSQDTVRLTEAHGDLSSHPVRLLFQNAQGRIVADISTERGRLQYPVHGLLRNHAYLCCMIMEGDTIRQPIVAGSLSGAETMFKSLRDSLPSGHPRADEVDQLLYRIWKLNSFTGKMREDYWFAFKFPWIYYQLEHVFTHLDGTYGNEEGENNIKFITYRSPLDDCLQRYILVSPNKVERDKKYPLVVIVRPNCEKFYHLFFCPQIAHQEVVNDMQAVANEYDTFVAMPEARMMLDEDFTPFINEEMKAALADVQKHYNIDEDRIFLHANCSGGYRALRFATYNPEMIAGIALYAPVYKRTDDGNYDTVHTPASMLPNLYGVPVFVYGDPVDTHSPYRLYADLLRDCRRYGIPYEFQFHRNTGEVYPGYHRYVIGRDACEFFKDKRRNHKTVKKSWRSCAKDTMIVDFYAKPFVYVYNATDTSAVYRQLVNDIREEYESYMYARLPYEQSSVESPRMPLLPDSRVTKDILEKKNVFLIGERFGCQKVKDFVRRIKANKMYKKREGVSLSAYCHPVCHEGMVLVYSSSVPSSFSHRIGYPWKRGFHRVMTAKMEK